MIEEWEEKGTTAMTRRRERREADGHRFPWIRHVPSSPSPPRLQLHIRVFAVLCCSHHDSRRKFTIDPSLYRLLFFKFKYKLSVDTLSSSKHFSPCRHSVQVLVVTVALARDQSRHVGMDDDAGEAVIAARVELVVGFHCRRVRLDDGHDARDAVRRSERRLLVIAMERAAWHWRPRRRR